MKIVRPAPNSVAARRHAAEAPQPSRPRRSAEGARWLDDQRREGVTAKLILDTKIALARDRGLVPRRR